MNPIVYAMPIFALSILGEAWLARRRKLATYDIPDAITSLHFGILSQISGSFMGLLNFGIYAWVFEHFRGTTLPSNQLWVWLFALLSYDFLYYWVHRAGHEVNLFWAAHQVHHSSEYYNLSTALRQTSTGALVVWVFYLPMALIGIPPLIFAAVALIDLLYQYWVHTELIRKLGWADRIFVTPSNHRVHHGQNDYCIDRNYGGLFIIWDRLFGTYTEERDDEPVVYGIRKPLASYNPVYGNLHIYGEIWRASRTANNVRAALSIWFAPPAGWNTALPHLDVTQLTRYDKQTPRLIRQYALFQYALLLLLVVHFIMASPTFTLSMRVLYALLLVGSALSLSWLLEGRSFARKLEAVRIVLLVGLGFWLINMP